MNDFIFESSLADSAAALRRISVNGILGSRLPKWLVTTIGLLAPLALVRIGTS